MSTRGVHGERNGISINNVGKLWMWNSRKMKYVTFIHNDDVKCFHVVIQGTYKLIMMGHINFKDHALIKRWQVDEKMNVTSRMFEDEKMDEEFQVVVEYVKHQFLVKMNMALVATWKEKKAHKVEKYVKNKMQDWETLVAICQKCIT